MDLKDKELKIRPQTPKEKAEKAEFEDTPKYRVRMKFNEDQIERLEKEVFDEFNALKNEREEKALEAKWEERDNQYHGNVKKFNFLRFNLHVDQSKKISDAIVRALNQAFIESDPKFDVTPRPEMARNDGQKVADNQADFLDYAMDEEIQPETALTLIGRSAVNKYVGIGKLFWAYEREKRKREETYQGKNVPVGVKNGQLVFENEGLKEFVKNYPEAQKQYPHYLKKLLEEKKVDIVVEYKDTVDNNPELKYIKLNNFYVRNNVDGYKGLRQANTFEREQYTWRQLKKNEQEGEFENVDEMAYQGEKNSKDDVKQFDDYYTKDYDVLECNRYFKLNEDDEEEVKVKCWFGEDRKTFLGAILYPYYGFDTDYIPFYVYLNDEGFYGDAKSVLYYLRHSNIAQNALLNIAVHGLYARSVLTPIIKEGSEIEEQFINNRWSDGLPLIVDDTTEDVNKAVGFVNYPPMDINGLMALLQMMKSHDGDSSGINASITGKENPIDPRAPGNKTIALLQQSGMNIKDYIRTALPSFNRFGANVLQLYYQMSQEGRKFKVKQKSKKVSGGDIFGTITRDEMVAKTNIQSRATAFAFDKLSEKNENMAMYQVLYSNPYTLRQPNILYKALLVLMKSWSPMWKNLADTVLPSPEEFKAQQEQVAMQAVAMLMKKAQQDAQNTGQEPQVNPEELINAVTQAQAQSFVPPEEKK